MYNMRITANMSSRNYNRSMRSVNSRMDYLYNCILTGQKFMKGSDNPKGANRAIFYNTLLEETATYMDNVTTAKGILTTADDLITNTISPVIGGTDGSSSSATSLMLSAINGDKSADEMRAIAADLEQKARALVGSMNQEYGGRKIFGGLNNSSTPFSIGNDKNGNMILTYNGVDVNQPKKTEIPEGIKVTFADSVKNANDNPGVAKTYSMEFEYGGNTYEVNFNGPTQNAPPAAQKTDTDLRAEAEANFMAATLDSVPGTPGADKVSDLFQIKDGKLNWTDPPPAGVSNKTDFSIKDKDATSASGQGLGITNQGSTFDYPDKGVYLDFSKASTPSSNPNLPGPYRSITLNGQKITFQTASLNKPDGTPRSEKELTDENWKIFMAQTIPGSADKVSDIYTNKNGYLEALNPANNTFTVSSDDARATGLTGSKDSADYEYSFRDGNGYVKGLSADEAKQPHKLFPGDGPIYIDVGMGLSYKADGSVNPDTALDISFNGAELLGCGTNSNGLSKNVIQSLLDAAQTLRDGANAGNVNEAKANVRAIHDQLIENQKTMMATHVSVGIRGNAVDFYENKLEGDKASYQKGLQDAMGLSTMEQAEYITDWKVVNSAYNACLQMGSKVIPPSIFDFIR